MADIGNLTAKLTLDTTQFSKGIGEVNGLVSGLAGGVGKALTGITATVGAAVAGATAAVGALVKESVQGFAQFEQLAGGAQKIFDQIDYAKIQADANNAWQTMNLSASQYLSLINNVGASFAATMGDQKGYDVAKQGMQAIADYASGTGRNVEELNQKFAMITRASSSYQSIADQFSGILPAWLKKVYFFTESFFIFKSLKYLFGVPAFANTPILLIADIYSAWCDDVGAGSNVLYLAVLSISNAVKEIKHSYSGRLVHKLHIENHGAALDKIIGNRAYLVK